MPGVVVSTPLASGKAIFGGVGHFLSPLEQHIIVVHPRSVELLTYFPENDHIQTIFEAPIYAYIIDALIMRISDSEIDSVVLLCSDFSVQLLSFQNSQIKCCEIASLRNEGVKQSNNIIMQAIGQKLIISLYPFLLYTIDITQDITFKELPIDKFSPKKIQISQNICITEQIDAFTICESFLESIETNTFPDANRSFEIPFHIDFWFFEENIIYIFTNNTLLLFDVHDFMINGFNKPIQEYQLPSKDKVSFSRIFPEGIFISFDDSTIFLLSNGKFRQLDDCPPLQSASIILENFYIYITKWNGFAIFDPIENRFLVRPDDIGMIRMHRTFSSDNIDKLVVCSGMKPSSLHVFGLALNFEKKAVIDSIKAVSLFASQNNIIISDADQSLFIERETLNEVLVTRMIRNEKTLAFYSEEDYQMQVTASTVVLMSEEASINHPIQAEFAAISKQLMAIKTNMCHVSIFEHSKSELQLINEFDVDGEICDMHIVNNFLIITTWNSTPLSVFDMKLGKLCSSFSETPELLISVAVVSGQLIFISSTGCVLYGQIDAEGIFTKIAETKVCNSATSITAFREDSDSALISGSEPTIVKISQNGLSFYPLLARDSFKSAVWLSKDEIAILSEHVVIFGKIAEPSITKQKSYNFNGVIECMDTSKDGAIAFVGRKNEKVIMNLLDHSLEEIASVDLRHDYYYNGMCSFVTSGRTFFAIASAADDGSGQVFFVEKTDTGAEYLSDLEFEQPILDVTFAGEYLVVAACSDLILHSVEITQASSLFLTVLSVQNVRIVTRIISSGTRVLTIGCQGDMNVYECGYGDLSLENTDDNARKTLSSNFFGQNGLIASTLRGELFVMCTSHGTFSMMNVARLFIGSVISTISPWKIPTECGELCIGTTLDGSIVNINFVENDIFEKLCELENAIIKENQESGDMLSSKYRRLVTPAYDEPAFGFADGDLIKDNVEKLELIVAKYKLSPDVLTVATNWIKCSKLAEIC